jgi:hypothetical protein
MENNVMMKTKTAAMALILLGCCTFCGAADTVGQWGRYEKHFTSEKSYGNPLYDVTQFVVEFGSPTGRVQRINGFWDGDRDWRVRFCPDEVGTWTFVSQCSDKSNKGLHEVKGSFECVAQESELAIYRKGSLVRPKGGYHLAHSDGTPFFWCACTAWNGALKSTQEEWTTYLEDRVANGYTAIQFVTTQWRGCDVDRAGEVAFTGSGRIRINPSFFQRLDRKVDQINDHGLIAAPVLLWALPFGAGRELSPGYYLPENEAILLARYTVARYGGHQVVWILGGDGRYVDEYEQRWKNIGRGVFGESHPGLVAQHPHGRSWIGREYADEDWLDIVGYQSSHSNARGTVDWINKGPMANDWDKLPARPIINLEPNYEEIGFRIDAEDVRNASYWSLLATPIAGITYGANGIWPWIRPGEDILNHGNGSGVTPWFKSIQFPGSVQIGYLSRMMQTLPWWRYRPCPELLLEQPGDETYNHFIAVAKTDDHESIVAYLPVRQTIKVSNPLNLRYRGRWFDPIENEYREAKVVHGKNTLEATSEAEQDFVLILEKE